MQHNLPEVHVKLLGNYYTDFYKNPLETLMYDILIYSLSQGVSNKKLIGRIKGYNIAKENYDLKKIWVSFRTEIDELSSKITAFNSLKGFSAFMEEI